MSQQWSVSVSLKLSIICLDLSLSSVHFSEANQMNLEMKEVLIHGDLWSTNLMWKRDENGHLQLKAIVDYQVGVNVFLLIKVKLHFSLPISTVLH